MSTRICLSCKEDVKGFVFCPNCGGKTEIIETQNNNPNPFAKFDKNPSELNQLAMWCHLGPLLIGVISFLLAFIAIGFILILFAWIPPVIIKSKNMDNKSVVFHANEALNFQFFWLITSAVLGLGYLVVGILTLGIGLIVGGILWLIIILPVLLFILISQIRAVMAASAGIEFRYPLVLFRLIK